MNELAIEALRLSVSHGDRGEDARNTVDRAAAFLRFLRGINEPDRQDMRRAVNEYDDRRMKDAE